MTGVRDDELDFYSEQPEEMGTDAPRHNAVRESELCLARVRRHSGGCYKLMDEKGRSWLVTSNLGVRFHCINEDGTTQPGVMMNYDMFRKLFIW